MADVDFDLAITLKYVLDLGDVEMEVVSESEDDTVVNREKCQHCRKTFKNNTTLNRHCAKYHIDEPEEMEKRRREILSAISACITDINTDLCLDEDTRQRISNYKMENLEKTSLINELSKMYKKLKKDGDAGEFYSSFYASVTLNSTLYFPNLPHPSCATLAIKLADKLLACTQEQPIADASNGASEENIKELSPMELGGLQYLAGYVIKNLIAKAKKWTKKCDKKVSELLSIFLAEDDTGQTLIAAKNRGGLSAVSEDGQKLFIETERKFR